MIYFMMFLHLLTTGNSKTLEERIVMLKSEVSAKTASAVAAAVREFAPGAGFTSDEDQNLILAVIYKESSFIQPREAGADGEWGMMQIIPTDGHIKKIAMDYRCNAEEQALPSYRVTMPDGTQTWHKICNGENPNIFSNKRVWPWKLSMLVKHSIRAGIFIGIHELKFWKGKYESGLKARFWNSTRSVPSNLAWWHTKVKNGLGDRLWVCHYNYGARIKMSPTGLSYPLKIMEYLKVMED
jgi:hypothetical protein